MNNAEALALRLTQNAAEMVNKRWREKQEASPTPTFGQQIPHPVRGIGMTATSPFSFEILPEQGALISEEEKAELSQWCKEEVKNMIALEPTDLTGMILGYAKQGQNFFKQW